MSEPSSPAAGHERPDDASREREARQQASEDRSAPPGHEVYGAIEQEGESELRRSNSALAWSGLAAGMSMGFSMVAQALLTTGLPAAPWAPLVAKLGYSMGFLIVVLARQQLFTENTLTVILPLLHAWDRRTLLNVLRLWACVLAANLVGALAFAWVAAHSSVFEANVRAEFALLGRQAMAPGFGTLFLRGIFAGWLIALMVWLLPYAETARIWVIILVTYVISLGNFSHCIAGSVDTLYLVVTGERGLGAYAGHFLAPALLGNVVGGVALVAALAHAQFVGSEQSDRREE
jgi:formate/nitrite transporter FocA (FNT family)